MEGNCWVALGLATREGATKRGRRAAYSKQEGREGSGQGIESAGMPGVQWPALFE